MEQLLHTIGDATKTVVKDQVGMTTDFYRHPLTMVLPQYLGLALVLLAIYLFVTSFHCKPIAPGSSKSKCKMKPGASFALPFRVGLLGVGMMAFVKVWLDVRHPVAASERAIASGAMSMMTGKSL